MRRRCNFQCDTTHSPRQAGAEVAWSGRARASRPHLRTSIPAAGLQLVRWSTKCLRRCVAIYTIDIVAQRVRALQIHENRRMAWRRPRCAVRNTQRCTKRILSPRRRIAKSSSCPRETTRTKVNKRMTQALQTTAEHCKAPRSKSTHRTAPQCITQNNEEPHSKAPPNTAERTWTPRNCTS